MKILVIIIVVLMVLAGAVIGTMKTMELGPFAPEVEGMSEEKLALLKPSFIPLDPLTVNVFSGNKIIVTLRVTLKLEARGTENYEFIYAHLPKISDVLFREMYAFLPRIISPEDKSLNVFLLKKRLKLITDKHFPKGQIYDVLVQTIDEIR